MKQGSEATLNIPLETIKHNEYLENGGEHVDEGNGHEIDDKELSLPFVRVHQGQGHDHQEHHDLTKLELIRNLQSTIISDLLYGVINSLYNLVIRADLTWDPRILPRMLNLCPKRACKMTKVALGTLAAMAR